jgi:hypothetical protein
MHLVNYSLAAMQIGPHFLPFWRDNNNLKDGGNFKLFEYNCPLPDAFDKYDYI